MHPIIWRISDTLAVKSYGVAIALAFLVAIYLSARKASKLGFRFNDFVDMGFWIIVSAIVGSRLFYILFHLQTYIEEPAAILKLWHGGLIFYGGFAAATAASFYFMYRKHIPIWLGADIVAPNVALGYAITRVGCFLNGCCFGKATTLPWGVTFPPGSAAGEYAFREQFMLMLIGHPVEHLKLHPTQIYACLASLAIFAMLLILWRKRKFDGQIFWLYLILYPVYRFGVEFVRADNKPLLWIFTTPQIMSLALLLCALAAYFHLQKRGHLTTTAPAVAAAEKKPARRKI